MTDLKLYQDRKRAADEEVIRLKSEIDTLSNSGSDEDLQKAIEMLPALEEANTKANEAGRLYSTMREANIHATAASLFVSNDPESEEDEAEDEKVLTLAAFNALAPKERLAFSKAGGRIQD